MTRPAGRLRRHLYPLAALVRREVQKRYAGSVLGLAWTIVQPLTLIAVYAFVFGLVFRTERAVGTTAEFVVWLLAGVLPYLAISDGLQRSIYSLKEDRALLEREAFPAEIVPASRVMSASLSELVGLAILIVIGLATGVSLTGWLVLLPVLFLLRLLITLALAWMVSVLAVFITDLTEALSLVLTVWLFLTPIFYPVTLVPASLQWAVWLNPLYAIVTAYRGVLVDGRAPWVELGVMTLWALAFVSLATWFFRKAIDRAKDVM